MKQKYYFDTSIWIDLYLERGENGNVAKKLVRKIILEEEVIAYSDFTLFYINRTQTIGVFKS